MVSQMRLNVSHLLIDAVPPAILCDDLRDKLENYPWTVYPVKKEGDVAQIGYGRACEMPYKLAAMHKNKNVLDATDPIAESIQDLVDWMNSQDTLRNFEPIRSCIATLAAGADIRKHRDKKWLHANSRRMHIPLKTNTECWHTGFCSSKPDVYRMETDRFYEINNVDPHLGGNNGIEDRWHLVVDFIPVGFLEQKIAAGVNPIADVKPGTWPEWMDK
jgi:Aspartyl/Asparaginyl beta-hydroxylase